MATPILLDTALLCCVALAAATDLAWRKIPNRLVLAGLAGALALQAGAPLTWLGGALTGLLLFLPLYLLRGMAAGDVKLMAVVGAFAGPALALQVGLATLLIGGVMGALVVLGGGRARVRAALANLRALLAQCLWRAAGAAPAPLPCASVGGLPYGVAIALGTAAALLWRHL